MVEIDWSGSMEPSSLAAPAVGLLILYFNRVADKLADRAGEAIADSAVVKVRSVYERIRARLAPGTYEGALLEGVGQQPDDPDRQHFLKAELAKILAEDRQFADDLERLVAAAQAATGGYVVASNAGVVAGRDARLRGRYVAGRDMKIGDLRRDSR